MKQSLNIANLAKSLIVAHTAIQSSVAKNSTNKTFSSAYADLGSVIEAIKSHLNKAGIAVIQSPTLPDLQGNVCLTTRLIHETGEWMEDTCSTPMTHLDPQGFGSAVSYLRRYALSAMMGLYQADDDGAAATGVRAEDTAVTTTLNKAPPVDSSAPKNENEVMSPHVQKRVDSWLNTIKNASLERLDLSRASVKTTFSGLAFEIVSKAFDERIATLRSGDAQTV